MSFPPFPPSFPFGFQPLSHPTASISYSSSNNSSNTSTSFTSTSTTTIVNADGTSTTTVNNGPNGTTAHNGEVNLGNGVIASVSEMTPTTTGGAIYRCLQCHCCSEIKLKDAVRCKICGYRILTKEPPSRARVFIAR